MSVGSALASSLHAGQSGLPSYSFPWEICLFEGDPLPAYFLSKLHIGLRSHFEVAFLLSFRCFLIFQSSKELINLKLNEFISSQIFHLYWGHYYLTLSPLYIVTNLSIYQKVENLKMKVLLYKGYKHKLVLLLELF